jgi:type III pantothenate kinase
MVLVVDAGNTVIKLGVFEQGKLVNTRYFDAEASLIKACNENESAPIVIASVSQSTMHLKNLIKNPSRLFQVSTETATPIINLYQSPSTLGSDRLAGVVGASAVFPNTDCLVIDLGTCATYDFISHSREYYGGSISPGLGMRLKAMNTFTAKLPLVEASQDANLVGTDTISAINSGAVLGLLYEIEGFIAEYSKKYPQLKVLICGGNASFFESKIKAPIFVLPELVLIGLERIYAHNVS